MPSRGVSAPVGVGRWIERRARIAPDVPALVHGDSVTSYAGLAERVRRLANGFRHLGVERGDRVAWLGPNHPAFIESLFAAGLLGAAMAPVNPHLDGAVVDAVLEEVSPAVLISLSAELAPVGPVVTPIPGSGRAFTGKVGFEQLVGSSPDDPVEEAVDLDDVLLLPHTSGTTGLPKGVMLTHGNVTWNVVNLLSVADFRSGDVTIAIAPFFRAGGTGVNVLPVLLLGGTVVVPAEVNAEEILRLVERHRVTVGFGNPDILEAIVRSPSWPTADLSSVRFVITGGAPVPERLIRTYLDRGLNLLQGYGLSEAGPVALLLSADRALAKVGAAGRPPMLVDVRVEGPGGKDAAPGETGELLVRGPNVMAGYWRRPQETAEVLSSDGWLRSGDAARLDEDGDVWIVDRVSARFEVPGGPVYPGDVERVLMHHPAVADAGVTRVDPDGSPPRIVAFVVLEPDAVATEEDLLAHSREHLAPDRVPASVVVVPTLPRNSVGKLVRSELAALARRTVAGPR